MRIAEQMSERLKLQKFRLVRDMTKKLLLDTLEAVGKATVGKCGCINIIHQTMQMRKILEVSVIIAEFNVELSFEPQEKAHWSDNGSR